MFSHKLTSENLIFVLLNSDKNPNAGLMPHKTHSFMQHTKTKSVFICFEQILTT